VKSTLTAANALRPFLADIPIGDTVLVGVSGGADSLALAIALYREARDRELKVIPVVLNHNLQAGSREIAEVAVEQLHVIGYHEVVLRDLQVEVRDGLESSARRARYEEFERVMAERSATALFLGHTHNDQAESVLLGLVRGSGGKSLAGMAPVNGRYIRPLLSLTRTITEEICAENKIEFWVDPHNSQLDFARVRIRTQLLPLFEELLGPGIADALVRTATLLRQDTEALDELASAAGMENPDLNCAQLAKLPLALRSRLLRSAIYAAGAPSGSLSSDHLAPVEALVTDWHGQGQVSLPGGVKVERISGRLSLSQQKENRGPSH